MGAAAAATVLVRAGCRNVFVTRGARGVLWARDAGGGEVAIEELTLTLALALTLSLALTVIVTSTRTLPRRTTARASSGGRWPCSVR